MKKNNPIDELKAAIEDSAVIIKLEAEEGADAPVHVQLEGDIRAIASGLCVLMGKYLTNFVPEGRAEILKEVYQICMKNLSNIAAET